MSETPPFRVALIGRPNVGKSTLFNKIVGKQMAIVHDQPGVTRDFREAEAYLYGHHLTMIDTAGLEDKFDDSIPGRMRAKTEAASVKADLLVFILDGRDGVTPIDEHFADWLRRQPQPKLLVVNKCESSRGNHGITESYSLGLGEPVPISAEHGNGLASLYDAMLDFAPEPVENNNENTEQDDTDLTDQDRLADIEGDEDFDFVDEDKEELEQKPLKIAIVGRPNAGKSTLVNQLIGEERVMVGPEAGITRDAIAIDWEHNGRTFKLVDTAGLRRKSKIVDAIEKMSAEDSYRAIRLAQVVVLVLDSTLGMDKQDLMIAAHTIEEGRALIIALNKWDLIEDKEKFMADIKYRLETSLGQLRNPPIQPLSALTGRHTDKLLDKILNTYELWQSRVTTGKLNRWLEAMVSHHPPALVKGRPNRLRYMAQINTRPPTFALWGAHPKALGDAYKRYLINGLRENFGITGVPIRLLLRKSKNPYKN